MDPATLNPVLCSVDGCTRPTRTAGMCSMHYQRWWKRGDVGPVGAVRFESVMDSFHAKYEVDAVTGCWVWTAAMNPNGDGQFHNPTRHRGAHRFAYETFIGPVPDGLELDHLCRRPACCNPEHLEPVTHAENMRRAARVRTTCPLGHPFEGSNLIMEGGTRRCRICRRANSARQYQRRKALAE